MRRILATLLIAAFIAGCGSAPAATPEEPPAEAQTTEATETAPEPEPEPAPEKPDLSALPLDEYLKAMIVEETGDSTYWVGGNVPRIRDDGIVLMEMETGTGAVLSLNADDNLTPKWMRASMLEKTTAILKRLYTERQDAPVKTVIQWYFPVEDAYGNAKEIPVMTVSMSAETAAKINWDKFRYTNLPDVADSYAQHAAFGE